MSARNNDNRIPPSQISQSNLTAPSQISQSNLTAPSQTIQPGYSRAQLYVKSRQLLWEVLSGALAASTVAVDWRGVIQLSQVTTLTLLLLSPSLCYLHFASTHPSQHLLLQMTSHCDHLSFFLFPPTLYPISPDCFDQMLVVGLIAQVGRVQRAGARVWWGVGRRLLGRGGNDASSATVNADTSPPLSSSSAAAHSSPPAVPPLSSPPSFSCASCGRAPPGSEPPCSTPTQIHHSSHMVSCCLPPTFMDPITCLLQRLPIAPLVVMFSATYVSGNWYHFKR